MLKVGGKLIVMESNLHSVETLAALALRRIVALALSCEPRPAATSSGRNWTASLW